MATRTKAAKPTGQPRRRHRAAHGARFPYGAAQAIGERIESLGGAGLVTPEQVVEDSRDAASPLHPYFLWDDSDEAARLHRLEVARHVLRHLVVIVEHPDGQRPAKAFHNLRIVDPETEKPARAYADMATVQNSPDFRRQVVEGALREAEAWQARYRDYAELFPISEAIDRVRERLAAGEEPGANGADPLHALRLRIAGFLTAHGPSSLEQLARGLRAMGGQVLEALQHRWFEKEPDGWHLTAAGRVRARKEAGL